MDLLLNVILLNGKILSCALICYGLEMNEIKIMICLYNDLNFNKNPALVAAKILKAIKRDMFSFLENTKCSLTKAVFHMLMIKHKSWEHPNHVFATTNRVYSCNF